jgi:hypothetical protein
VDTRKGCLFVPISNEEPATNPTGSGTLLTAVTGSFKNGPMAVDGETHRAFVLDPYYNTMTVLAKIR